MKLFALFTSTACTILTVAGCSWQTWVLCGAFALMVMALIVICTLLSASLFLLEVIGTVAVAVCTNPPHGVIHATDDR